MTATDERVARLRAAAAARSAEKTKAAEAAIRRLVKAGKTVNFRTVQQEAGVSHAFLYSKPELRQRIERLRASARPAPAPAPTEPEQAQGNLLAAVTQHLRQTRSEYAQDVRGLRDALERAHGENLALRRELAMSRGPELAGRTARDVAAPAPATELGPGRDQDVPAG